MPSLSYSHFPSWRCPTCYWLSFGCRCTLSWWFQGIVKHGCFKLLSYKLNWESCGKTHYTHEGYALQQSPWDRRWGGNNMKHPRFICQNPSSVFICSMSASLPKGLSIGACACWGGIARPFKRGRHLYSALFISGIRIGSSCYTRANVWYWATQSKGYKFPFWYSNSGPFM